MNRVRPCEPFAEGFQYERVKSKRSRGQNKVVMAELETFRAVMTVLGLDDTAKRIREWLP